MDNWEKFRDKYLDKILECDSCTEKELLNVDIRNYILENDDFKKSILRVIANCSSEQLRNYYFSPSSVDLLIKNNKFSWIMDSKPFFPNKINLLNKDYILEEICSYNHYYMGRITGYILSGNQEYTTIMRIIDYCLRDIPSFAEALNGVFSKLPDDVYELLVKKYEVFFKQKAKDDNVSFQFLFSKFRGFNYLFNTIDIFEGINEIVYSPVIVKHIIENLSILSDYNDNEDFFKYKERIYNYLLQDAVKENFLENLNSSFEINKLVTNFGEDIIKKYFDFLGIKFLKEKDKLNYLLHSDVELKTILTPKEMAEILDNMSLEEFHNSLRTLKEKNIDILKLLSSYLEINNYEGFYKVFCFLTDQEQVAWFSLEENKRVYLKYLVSFPILAKGMKKSLYSSYNDYFDYTQENIFSIYELSKIIEDREDYSPLQLIKILTNKSNMFRLLEDSYFPSDFLHILNLDINLITEFYLDKDFQKEIRSQDKLADIYYEANYHYPLDYNNERFLTIEGNLDEIGSEISEEYAEVRYKDNFFEDYKYKYFFRCIEKLKDQKSIYKVLDFFLKNAKYLKAFQLVSKDIDKNLLEQYYKERADLITKVVNTGDLKLIENIFINLDSEELEMEVTKERIRFIYALSGEQLYEIFVRRLNNSYKLYESDLDLVKFLSIFKGQDYYLSYNYLDGILPEEDFRKRLILKVREHNNIMEEIFDRLGDTYEEFLIYLKIINRSSFKDSLSESKQAFINDLKNTLLKKDYLSAIDFSKKYKYVDIKKFKLEILEEIKNKSRLSVISSLTDLSKCKSEIQVYKLRNKTYKIPTIVFAGEPYNFLIRRMHNGKRLNNNDYMESEKCYSTIYEENRSVFYGDTGIKFGYSNVAPEDITYMYPFDAISNNFTKQKYYQSGLKIPAWLSAEDLNKKAKNNKCYNEIRIYGKYFPDFVVSYDEPNEVTIDYAGNNNTLMVKILRKSYPNSIEFNDDPYKDAK